MQSGKGTYRFPSSGFIWAGSIHKADPQDTAWSYGSRRFWLHTCTKDHPAALPNYLKAGFTVYKEEIKESQP